MKRTKQQNCSQYTVIRNNGEVIVKNGQNLSKLKTSIKLPKGVIVIATNRLP